MSYLTWMYLRHDFFRVCAWVAFWSLANNFVPPSEPLSRYPRIHAAYGIFILFVAFNALSWRSRIPSLDEEWMGFKSRRGR